MIDCPQCGSVLADNAVICNRCRWNPKPASLSDAGQASLEARHRFTQGWPTSANLTEQQWYNVCKYFPTIAARCRRSRPSVGPEHPLDKKSSQGPFLRHFRRRSVDLEAAEERAAIQDEAA